jgi:hypothetical protein
MAGGRRGVRPISAANRYSDATLQCTIVDSPWKRIIWEGHHHRFGLAGDGTGQLEHECCLHKGLRVKRRFGYDT